MTPIAKRVRRIHVASAGRDDFLCGYAAALGAVQRLFDEGKIVSEVLKCDGLTLAHLRAARVEAFDMRALRKAGCK